MGKTMKNPAEPGDFGTNGTRGVVGSGMSETTKRAIPTDLMDLGTRWAERVDATHLIAKPVPYHAARANLRAAEGGAERETTNSPAKIGMACTGLEWVILTVAFLGAALIFGIAAGALWSAAVLMGWPVAAAIMISSVGMGWLVSRRASGGGEK